MPWRARNAASWPIVRPTGGTESGLPAAATRRTVGVILTDMLATQTYPAAHGGAVPGEPPARATDPHRLKTSDRLLIERATHGFEVLQGKWKVHLIVALARGIRRPSRLHACLPGISKKVMTDCLRGLERDGLVTREIYAQVPIRVDYSLTPLGWTITDAILALSEWGKHHRGDVTRARSDYWLRAVETDEILDTRRTG
jgi:DNA-binding HxlR family transcriptional regulator